MVEVKILTELSVSVCTSPRFKNPKSLPKLMLLTIRDEVIKLLLRPTMEDCKEADDKYPSVPNPWVVLTKLLANPKLLMKLTVPKPTTVEANSVGSMKDEINVCNAIVVLCNVLAR